MHVALAGVEHHQPPAAESQRHRLDARACGSRCSSAVLGRAVERGELVEQARVGADPVVLHARAQPGDLGSLRSHAPRPARRAIRGRAARGTARPRAPPRRTGRRRAAARRRSRRRAPTSGHPARGELGDRPAHERPPAARGRGRRPARTRRARPRSRAYARSRSPGEPARRCLGAHGDALGDRERQREPLVVVGVLADQVDAAGRERAAALTRHGRSPRAAAAADSSGSVSEMKVPAPCSEPARYLSFSAVRSGG